VQLLRSYVPKAPNDTADLTVFFAHSGSTYIKAVRRTLMKLSPDGTILSLKNGSKKEVEFTCLG